MSIALGGLSPANIRDLDTRDRALIFVRRAAAEIAFAAWLFADEQTRAGEPPWTPVAAGQLARQLVQSMAVTGFRWPGDNTSAAQKFLDNTRLGLLHGWRLAAKHSRHDLLPRFETPLTRWPR